MMNTTVKDLNCLTCPDGFPCGITGVRLAFVKKSSALRILTSSNGCIYHPQTREYLMQEIVKELERLEKLYHEESEREAEAGNKELEERLWGEYLGITEAISLIKNGVKK